MSILTAKMLFSRKLRRCLFFLSVGLVVVACGGGSDPEPEPVTGVDPATNCPTAKTHEVDHCEPTSEDTPIELALNTPISGTLAERQGELYKVPADTQIMLTTQSGNADLFLYDNEDLKVESLICIARDAFIEDICSASPDSGQLFALVFAPEESTYTINASADCSVPAINQWVYRSMQDYYLFADQVPTVNPDVYENERDLIEALRYNAMDPFSNVGDATTQLTRFEEGKTFGLGNAWGRDTDGQLKIVFVYADSPFGRANIKRGDIVHKIGGILETELSGEQYFEIVGTPDEPKTSTWEFIDGDTGNIKTITVMQSEYSINTVLYTSAFSSPEFSGKIGYLVFNEFLGTSDEELDIAINGLLNEDVTELILDLRYNGGGFTHIARRLAAQISGPTLDGKQLIRYEYNNKYSDENFSRDFEAASPSLDLTRLIVLTSGNTASSSEIVINSLRPYIEVVTIGGTTVGKNFISSGRDFCGKTINAMEAQGVNANGVSVTGGISADCYAADDPTRNFGTLSGEIEGMLAKALDYVVLGTCDAAPTTTTIASRNSERQLPDERLFVGAHVDSP